MITVDLALRLRAAGLRWEPASGDRFAIPYGELAGDVFVVSDMTIDTAEVAGTQILRFNGTTEWAMDSVAAEDVVWLPGEAQLRAHLGPAFRSLVSTEIGYAVDITESHGQVSRHVAGDAECAYALALLALFV